MVKRASFGSPAYVADPTGVRAGLPKSNSQGDDDFPDQGSSNVETPGNPSKRSRLSRVKLGAGRDEGDAHPDSQGSSGVATPGQTMRLTAEDIDINDDVESIFEGSDFSEEFKDKAKTVFETAVVAKINEQLDILSEELEAEIEEARDAASEELSEQLDKYLNYVVEQWMEENQLAVETGIKAEMVESFLAGFRNLMTEHYVDIPEEESDVVEQLAARISELEESLGEEIEKNVELSTVIQDFAKSEVFSEIAEGLTESQVAKLESLSEAIAAEDIDDYANKLQTIRESYFSDSNSSNNRYDASQFDEEEIVDLNEEAVKVDPSTARYTQHLSKVFKK